MINDKSRSYGKTKRVDIETLRRCFQNPALANVTYAALFGSRAEGNGRPQSDYDIAVYGDDKHFGKWGMQAEVWGILSNLCGVDDCDLDIVDLAAAPRSLLESIAKKHILLKGDSHGFSELLGKLAAGR
ncbi:nucleotidyltransferase domain-containing protein [Hydrogenimonas sp. SS33]|uniref:nucleotidyltransferase family protein n=1 Tax=Hydrogenimonas leucolamina TaxID=2954236 RepID=UPI00336C14E4